VTLVHLLAAATVSAAVAALAVPLAMLAARRWGVLDRPGGHKQHEGAVPLLGGLGVVAGTLAGVAWGFDLARPGGDGLGAIAVGAAVVLAAGLLDDLRGLSPGVKLAWQTGAAVAAAAALALLEVRLDVFVPNAAVTTALTVLWVVAVTNASNLVDHANGLCAGLAALAAAALAALNLRTGAEPVALAAAALAGACLGFLPWNWPRARVFLGDAGSMTIGFALAALAVLGVYTPRAPAPRLAIAAPALALAVPLLDMAVVVALRLRSGKPPWLADRRHVAHRLVARGLPPGTAVAAVWAAGAACALAACLLPALPPAEGLAVGVALAAALAAGAATARAI
jgi:UDP-GlcNAc:undecaprenyl-phosphate GlcNAc-1-phosphate transferase